MLFHFETKRRWQITIVSPGHNIVEKIARPGPRSLTCNNSKSSVFTNNCEIPKVPVSSRYPKDPAEEDWPPSYSASRPKHRSSLRRICRYLLGIHRMYDRHATNGSHGGLPPPPYEQSQREELAASSVYEVPEPLLTTAELDGHALMPELQDSALNANDYTNTWEGYLTSSVYSDATKHWVADVGYTLPRPLIPIETPKLPWSLNTEHQFAPRPGVVSGGQSHEYSPTYVSPVTPRQDDSSASQPYPPYSFSDGTISPQSLMSPPDNNWAGPPPFHATHSYNTQSSFASSLESSPTEPSSAYSQSDSADQLMLPHVPVSSNVSPSSSRVAAYNMNNRHPFAPQPSVVGPQPHCHHTAKTVPGIYEYHESLGWHRHPNQEPTPSDANRDDHLRIVRGQPESPHYVDHSKERQQGTLIHGEDSFHHAPPARHPPLDEETVPPPAKPCGECNKVFHGRYRVGNLRRHKLAFHNPMASAVEIACRECKRVYKRMDAKRKHEWKKHRIPDARPKKRAN